jgi:hypothetical protein
LDPYVELLGKVEQDCSLSIQRVVNFGADFGKYIKSSRLSWNGERERERERVGAC